MPCTMMHLACAVSYTNKYKCSENTAFYLGNVSPDCIDIRDFKDKNHLRIYDKKQRNQKLIELALSYDMTEPYMFGVVFHLYTDYLWDHGPMTEHKRNYVGDNWFLDYRADIRDISRYMYAKLEWSGALWNKLCEMNIEESITLECYPADKIRDYLVYNKARHELPGAVESKKFPHEDMLRFCDKTAEDFNNWLVENNIPRFS